MMSKLLTISFILIVSLMFSGCESKLDGDTDQDAVENALDNCPGEANTYQEDMDKDGIGDVCDDDIDGDGFSNEHEVIAKTDGLNPDSLPNLSADKDRDSVGNNKDKCPNTPIGRQVDADGCEVAKVEKMTENFSNEIKLNPPRTEPMIPKWGFGYMQSGWGGDQFGYGRQETFLDHAKALRGLANQYGDHTHPADIMVLDMFWTGKEWSWPGNMTWDKGRFPEPKDMIDELHAMNYKIMMNYHESGFGDEWLEKLQRDLDYGSDIVWLDFWRADSKYETKVWELLQKHHGKDKRLLFLARHYARPNNHNQEAVLGGDYMRKPDEESIEKSMPAHWTGDVLGTWEGFAESIDGIVYSEDGAMGGWSYLHTDTPGHTLGEDPELATRWIQFSDFTTMTRNHGTTGRDVWSWGPKVEEHSRFSRSLRYRLLPYIYTYSWHIWKDAIPLTRPLKLAYPGQRDELKYQYMFGEELLVAPVYKAAASFPENKMAIYLPSGEQWINYWTHKVHDGGETITVNVSKNQHQVPLYVKRGAIIPMGPAIQWIDTDVHANPITFDIFPLESGSSDFTLYDDDGESLGYQRGEYTVTQISTTAAEDVLRVSIGASKGDYDGKPRSQNYILKINLMNAAPKDISLNGKALEELSSAKSLLEMKNNKANWAYDRKGQILYLKFSSESKLKNSVTVNF
jgi:hypothetical protein